MFIYLSKKIAIPNGRPLNCLDWLNSDSWLACGGDQGFLKVLQLSLGPSGQPSSQNQSTETASNNTASITAPAQLTMNQSLDAHRGNITSLVWNRRHGKLTTADDQGSIVVWILYKGVWYEEMVNQRNKSPVVHMQWNRDGEWIGILYQDGSAMVGSVDGQRKWVKELKAPMKQFQWSPDGHFMLTLSPQGDLFLYDDQGSYLTRVNIFGDERKDSQTHFICMDWYNGYFGCVDVNAQQLALADDQGRVYLLKNEKDSNPVIIETDLRDIKLRWNANGSILAVGGAQVSGVKSAQGGDGRLLVSFYTFSGQYLRSLRVPGQKLSDISWELSGLRLVLAVDSNLFFAHIRQYYRWSYLPCICNPADGGTVVFAASNESGETVVRFWNTRNNEINHKILPHVSMIAASNERCVIVSKIAEEPSTAGGSFGGVAYSLQLCDTLGTVVESKTLALTPSSVAINEKMVIVVAQDASTIGVWFLSVSEKVNNLSGIAKIAEELDIARQNKIKEKWLHVDDLNAPSATDSEDASSYLDYLRRPPSADPLIAICATKNYLYCIRDSGKIMHFLLPSFRLLAEYDALCRERPPVTGLDITPSQIQIIKVNCNDTKIAVIDAAGIARTLSLDIPDSQNARLQSSFVDLNSKPTGKPPQCTLTEFIRRDVWDICWASDNPDLFALMEKTRMYIFRGNEPEEPISTAGYLCNFTDLQVRVVKLDEIMQRVSNAQSEKITTGCIDVLDTKSLRDSLNILKQVGIKDAIQYVESCPHRRLWRLIAEQALLKLDLSSALTSFLKCQDYPSIQFVKQLQTLDDPQKQKAEVEVYFKNFENAERIYLSMDRTDLAVDMYQKIGNPHRTFDLLKAHSHSFSNYDYFLQKTVNALGDHWYERRNFDKALEWFAKSHNDERFIDCLFLMDDFDRLEKFLHQAPDHHLDLESLAIKFATVGLAKPAISLFLKSNNTQAAIETCVSLNQWDQAMALTGASTVSQKFGQNQQNQKAPEVRSTMIQYASHLISKGHILDAVEVYKRAGEGWRSAKMLFEIAEAMAGYQTRLFEKTADSKSTEFGISTSPIKRINLLLAKKCCVQAASELKRLVDGGTSTQSAGLLKSIASINCRFFSPDNWWQAAEALHFFLLAQRQFKAQKYFRSMLTCLRAAAYPSVIIPQKPLYSMLALGAYHCGYYSVCSNAFSKLESILKEHIGFAEDDEIFDLLADSISETVHVVGLNSLSGDSSTVKNADSSGMHELRRQIDKLAVLLFTTHGTEDQPNTSMFTNQQFNGTCRVCHTQMTQLMHHCPTCQSRADVCIASGLLILGSADGGGDVMTHSCGGCKKSMLDHESSHFKFCPLCHCPL